MRPPGEVGSRGRESTILIGLGRSKKWGPTVDACEICCVENGGPHMSTSLGLTSFSHCFGDFASIHSITMGKSLGFVGLMGPGHPSILMNYQGLKRIDDHFIQFHIIGGKVVHVS